MAGTTNPGNTVNIHSQRSKGQRVAAKFKVESTAGGFRWVLTSQGRTLATSEVYARKVSATKAIESLRTAAATATLDDQTAKRAAKPVVAKAARAAGRTVGKAAVKVEKGAIKAEKAAVRATKKAVRTARKATPATKTAAKSPAKKAATPRRRDARTS
jgi:DNA-binding protein HU-beta